MEGPGAACRGSSGPGGGAWGAGPGLHPAGRSSCAEGWARAPVPGGHRTHCEGCSPAVIPGVSGPRDEGDRLSGDTRQRPKVPVPKSKGLEVTRAEPFPEGESLVSRCGPFQHPPPPALSLMYVKILKALVCYIKNYVSCSAFFYLLKLFKQQKHFTC